MKGAKIFAIAVLALLALTAYMHPVFAVTGDVNGDGKVDGKDLTTVAQAFGSYGPDYLHPGSPPNPRWNPAADLKADNKIDGADLTVVASNFGKS
jgi:hypothetical protein